MKKKSTNAKINVLGTEVTVVRRDEEDYISLTDMLKAKDGDFFISDWLRNRTPSNSLAFGSPFTIRLLIMANSP